jgi:antitoxin (DNA-binding transcriptional repressor) of toxin-antitoxin stability system
VAKLKNSLSKYIGYAKAGEEVIIRDRNLPVAKLVPFVSEDFDEHELAMIAAGKMRPPKQRLNLKKFLKMPIGRVEGHAAIDAITADREET